MMFTTPDYQNIKDGILRDIVNQEPDAAVGPDSDYAVRASGEAAAIEGLYQHQQWLFKQIFPDSADDENLIRHAEEHGITRKSANAATGAATLTGSIGAPIPAGTKGKTVNGIAFVTTAAAEIGGAGTAVVTISASVAGVSGNQPVNTALTLTSAPPSINTAAIISTATTGGYEQETLPSLLDRLLFELQSPPQGGNLDDYKRWAREVPGVGYAYIYGQRRNTRSVDIVILDDNGALPDAPLVDACQAHIELKRNVTADCWVFGPTDVLVPVTAALVLSGTTLAEVTPIITEALQAYFRSLKPGDTVILKQIEKLIMSVTGVVDCTVTAPAANVTALVDATHVQLLTLGAVTLS
jgi:uncharacterized phage protein gp47/JayE